MCTRVFCASCFWYGNALAYVRCLYSKPLPIQSNTQIPEAQNQEAETALQE